MRLASCNFGIVSNQVPGYIIMIIILHWLFFFFCSLGHLICQATQIHLFSHFSFFYKLLSVPCTGIEILLALYPMSKDWRSNCNRNIVHASVNSSHPRPTVAGPTRASEIWLQPTFSASLLLFSLVTFAVLVWSHHYCLRAALIFTMTILRFSVCNALSFIWS